MALMNLFNRQDVVTRYTGDGYIDDDENYVSGEQTTFTIDCNIQPYREGKNAFNNDTGYRTIDALKVYTPTELRAADEDDNTSADEITYEGKLYFCKDLERWNPQTDSIGGTSLIPAHYLGYFYRKDKT